MYAILPEHQLTHDVMWFCNAEFHVEAAVIRTEIRNMKHVTILSLLVLICAIVHHCDCWL